MIHTPADLERLVVTMGILPFFKNDVEGFSIDEHTPRHLWFSDYEEGPWEWKSAVIGGFRAAYGKFFQQKTAFVRLDLYRSLLALRRRGQTPLSLCATEGSRRVYQAICESETLLTTDIRQRCGFAPRSSQPKSPSGRLDRHALQASGLKAPTHTRQKPAENLETLLTRMQMGGILTTADFEYRHTADGRAYGWGVARYTTPELLYPDLFAEPLPDPQQALDTLTDHLTRLLPNASEAWVRRFLAG